MLNRVQLIGHLVRSPEFGMLEDRKLFLKLLLEVEKNALGEPIEKKTNQESKEVFEVIILKENLLNWGKNTLAERSLIYIEGRLGYKDSGSNSLVVFVRQHGQLQLLNTPEISAKHYRNFLDELQKAFPSSRSYKRDKVEGET